MPSANSGGLCISEDGASAALSHMTAAPPSREALVAAEDFIEVHSTRGIIARAWKAQQVVERAQHLKERMDAALDLLQV